MIDEISQFYDKGDVIIEHLCEAIGENVLAINFQYFGNTSINFKQESITSIFEYLSSQLELEVDIVRRKCLVFISAKLIEITQIKPSFVINLLNDGTECPYVLFRLAYVLYHWNEFQARCIEIFRLIILNKENHMDIRYESIEILNRLAETDNNPALIPIFLEIINLEEYYFEDPYFAGHGYGATIITDDTFDPDYSEYWIIDVKELAIDGLTNFPEQFECIANPLLKFMTQDYQIDEYIEAIARTFSSYIYGIPHASRFLLEKLAFLYNTNEGAKLIIDEIMEFHGMEDFRAKHQLQE